MQDYIGSSLLGEQIYLECFLITVCVNFLAIKYSVLVLAAQSFLTLYNPCTI